MCRGSRQDVDERGHRCNITIAFVRLLILSSELCSTAWFLHEVHWEDPFLWYPLWVGWILLNLRLRSLCPQCMHLCVNQVSRLPFWGLEGTQRAWGHGAAHDTGDWTDATLRPTLQTFIDPLGNCSVSTCWDLTTSEWGWSPLKLTSPGAPGHAGASAATSQVSTYVQTPKFRCLNLCADSNLYIR